MRHTYADTYTLAYRLTGDEEDARDVVQEAYLRAFRGLERFRGDAEFSTWMYRITANCASTFLVRRTRHRHEELDDELAGDDRPAARPIPRGASRPVPCRERLQQALVSLPPRLRAVVVLRDVYDLPHEAIAAELGISVSAAKVRLHRARRRLREDLYPACTDEVADRERRPTDQAMRCDQVAAVLADAADGADALGAPARGHVDAVPALPGRGRPVPQAAAGAAVDARRSVEPAPGLLPELLAKLERGGGAAAPRRRCTTAAGWRTWGSRSRHGGRCGRGHRDRLPIRRRLPLAG